MVADLMRAGYQTEVQFFQDINDTTTIRWYLVPPGTPILPYASFVADEQWYDENGPRSGMDVGMPPGIQGERQGPRPFRRGGAMNPLGPPGVFCGTAEQWAGNLNFSNPADLGNLECCMVPINGNPQPGQLALWQPDGSLGGSAISIVGGKYKATVPLECGGGTPAIPPLILDTASLVGSPVNGGFEYDGISLYFTTGTGRINLTAFAGPPGTLNSYTPTTTAAYAPVFTKTNNSGMHGSFVVKNTGANGATVRMVVTDFFGTVTTGPDTFLPVGGLISSGSFDNPASLAPGSFSPIKTVELDCKDANPGNHTTLQVWLSQCC
jgi:hypothetical protein